MRQFSPESIRLLSAIAEELSTAANSWAPDARLVGNVRAGDITLLCDAWLSAAIAAELDSTPITPLEENFHA